MTLGDVFFYYVSGAIVALFIMFVYEAIRYDKSITDHIDVVGIVATGLFWPAYTIKHGLKGLVVVFNRLIYDMIHW